MNHTYHPFVYHKDALRHALADCHIASVFGHILREARVCAGYRKPVALSEAIVDFCGIEHSERSIYRYESGVNSAPVDFLVAASFVLSPEIFIDLLNDVLAPDMVGMFSLTHDCAMDTRKQLRLFRV